MKRHEVVDWAFPDPAPLPVAHLVSHPSIAGDDGENGDQSRHNEDDPNGGPQVGGNGIGDRRTACSTSTRW